VEILYVDHPVFGDHEKVAFGDHPDHHLRAGFLTVKNTKNLRDLAELGHLALLQGKGEGLVGAANGSDGGPSYGLGGERVGKTRWITDFPIPIIEKRVTHRESDSRGVAMVGADVEWEARVKLPRREFDRIVAMSRAMAIPLPITGPKSQNGAFTVFVRAIAQGRLTVSWATQDEVP